MLLLVLTILQYVVKQRTSLGFPLAIRAEAVVSQKGVQNWGIQGTSSNTKVIIQMNY